MIEWSALADSHFEFRESVWLIYLPLSIKAGTNTYLTGKEKFLQKLTDQKGIRRLYACISGAWVDIKRRKIMRKKIFDCSINNSRLTVGTWEQS